MNDQHLPVARPTVRRGLQLAVALAALGALPEAARAATSVTVSGGALVVSAAAGKTNAIYVDHSPGGQFIVTDKGDALAAGSGCTARSGWVECAAAGVARVSVLAADLDDYVEKTSPVSGMLDGGDGDDTLLGGPAQAWNELRGGPGDDALQGGRDSDLLYGGAGRDRLRGGDGADTLRGEDDADELDGGLDGDVLDGGTGIDVTSYATRASRVTVDIDGVADDGWPSEGDNVEPDVEGVVGGSADDVLTGSAASNRLDGGRGRDTIRGLGGNDTVTGGPHDDTLDGGEGRDVFASHYADGADVYAGGPGGYDAITYEWRRAPVAVDLDGAADDGEPGEADDVRGDVEQVTGGQAADILIGNGGANVLRGASGEDLVDGRGGSDHLIGSAADDHLLGADGDDVLDGGAGADRFDGGPGRDRADYAARRFPLTIDIDGVADDGEAGEADNVQQTVEDVTGGSASDWLWGSFAINRLSGGGGDDRINGLGGDDVLHGGFGSDLLLGGAGDDSLQAVDGIRGNDEVNGQTDVDACASDTDDEELACES